MLASASSSAVSKPQASSFALENGMEVVVIPDHRAPIVTHMVWYRAGAADGPKGVSGIAHFLEHLMFKGTDNIASGEFSKIVSRLGGQDNAFTAQDVTAYHQRVSKDQLRRVMEMEADRMIHLRITADEVETERQVVIEEQRSRVAGNVGAQFNEKMTAALYGDHPYGIPVIGWPDEIAKLSRDDAMRFYEGHYAPNNAVLVVSGDVAPGEVKLLAEETYGQLAERPGAVRKPRPATPGQTEAKELSLESRQVGKASFTRFYTAPSYLTAKPLEAEALEMLIFILGRGSASRLHRELVVNSKLAASVGGGYSGSALDCGSISFFATAKDGRCDALEAGIDDVLEEIRTSGVTDTELSRAKKRMLTHYISSNESEAGRARQYGMRVALGGTIEQVESWPAAISKVTSDHVKAVASDYLDVGRSVTGWLLPEGRRHEGIADPIAHSSTV